MRSCVGEMKQSVGEIKETVGEMKQLDGEMKQNVLGRCPIDKVHTTHFNLIKNTKSPMVCLY